MFAFYRAHRHLSFRVMTPLLVVLVVAIVLILALSLTTKNRLYNDSEEQALASLTVAFQGQLEDQAGRSLALATAYAELPAVKAALAEQDREALVGVMYDSWTHLDATFDVPFALFFTPPATAFVRLHKLEKFGDDVSDFRSQVVVANQEQRPVVGLEKGKAGYGMRATVPVTQDGQHLGVVEIGTNFGAPQLVEFAEDYGVEVNVMLHNPAQKVEVVWKEHNEVQGDELFTTYAASVKEPVAVDESRRLEVVTNARKQFQVLERHGVPHSVIAFPLRDSSNDVVGVVEIARSREAMLAQVANSRNLFIAFGAVLLIGLGGLVWLLLSRIVLSPVHRLDDAAKRVAKGDLSVTTASGSHDELGRLAESFNLMVGTIREGQERLLQEKASVEQKVQVAVQESEEQQQYLQRSVETMLSAMQRFADGDLTVAVTSERKDTIGKLFAGFNEAVAKQHETIERLGQSARTTSSTTQQIAASTEQLASAAQEQSAQAHEVAAAVEEMVQTITNTSHTTTQTAESAQKSGRVAREGGRIVQETTQKMQRIAEVVKGSAGTVERLGQRSQEIGQIVQVIDEIADQTNLLALNAAIEAARAGEHGRGFAVVANEVRNLAERTTQATRQIDGMITSIQQETAQAIETMREGTVEVEDGKRLAHEAGASLQEIVASAELTEQMIMQIATASQQQSATSEEMARSIDMISTVSQEAAQGVSEIAQAADGLNTLTDELTEVVSRFQLRQHTAQTPRRATSAEPTLAANRSSKSGYAVRSSAAF